MSVMKSNNYGSCQIPGQEDASHAARDRRRPANVSEIPGEKPHLVLVASSAAVLAVAVVLFVWHLRDNPPPLDGGRFMRTSHLAMSDPKAIAGTGGVAVVPDPNAYPRRPFITRHERNVTLPVLGFPSVALAQFSEPSQQPLADEAVRHAVEDLQISYFDVAPEYGDGIAQERLGPALEPYRERVFLAAKTMYRDAGGSQADLENTLRSLRTDRLDLYQFHSISTERDVEEILGEGGAMETFQKALAEGKIGAIGFSAHSEPMAVRMIESGLVDTCMFPINFAAYNYGGVGEKVLQAAIKRQVGVIALKAGARGRLTPANGNAAQVPEAFHHIPEWKRQEMIHYPVMTSPTHGTWYEPEDDPDELNKLILWSLNRPGVTAVLPPGSLRLLDGLAELLRGKESVPEFGEADERHMRKRYADIVPIFHNRSVSGTKVST
ncbi:hypothetical protein ACHAWF_002349 [Thalassiosira exigua]